MGDVEVGGNGSVWWRVEHEAPESPNPLTRGATDEISPADHGKHRGHDGDFLITLNFSNAGAGDMQYTLDSIRSLGNRITMRVRYVHEKHDQITINW